MHKRCTQQTRFRLKSNVQQLDYVKPIPTRSPNSISTLFKIYTLSEPAKIQISTIDLFLAAFSIVTKRDNAGIQ